MFGTGTGFRLPTAPAAIFFEPPNVTRPLL
jgi:hypothetical protein